MTKKEKSRFKELKRKFKKYERNEKDMSIEEMYELSDYYWKDTAKNQTIGICIAIAALIILIIARLLNR